MPCRIPAALATGAGRSSRALSIAKVASSSRRCSSRPSCHDVLPLPVVQEPGFVRCPGQQPGELVRGAGQRRCQLPVHRGLDRPDLYDPKINRSYAELAAHYGCLIDPARSRKPRDKARVERPMPYIRDSFWRGREWSSLEQMQADAVRWSAEVAGRRSCRPLDGAAPATVFAAAEQDALAPLPADPFVLAEWSRCKVGPDIHVKVGKTLYSVPWKLIGKTLDARSTATMVQLFAGGDLVKTHVRKPAGKQTDLGDYPPEKIAFHMRTPVWCRKKAAEIGPACQELIAALLEDNALYRLRAAQGVIGLDSKHQPGRLEAACAKAIAAGDPSYRTVKGILTAGTEADPVTTPAGDGGAAAFLHGPDALFAAGPFAAGNVVPIRAGAEGRAS